MTYFDVVLIVVGSGLAAGLLSWITRRTFRLEYLRRHHEIGGAVFLQLGVIYAVLLAFVFSEVWSGYNTAANAINQECGSLHGAAMLAASLPADQAKSIETALAAYIATVIDQEWPEMAKGRSSEAARQALAVLLDTVARSRDAQSGDEVIRARILSELSTAHQWRETRLFQMTLGVPALLWVLLTSLGLVLVGFLLCFEIENIASQVAFTAVFAAALAFVLVLVYCLDYPFEGSLRLGPGDFQSTLQRVTILRNA